MGVEVKRGAFFYFTRGRCNYVLRYVRYEEGGIYGGLQFTVIACRSPHELGFLLELSHRQFEEECESLNAMEVLARTHQLNCGQ